ncbi:glycosyltransferase family 4 protein [Loigolactobacillus bifermentans]|uniref:Glycosyltransferase n=1 Tax=Loigolactobacillus bifermentans DSM 20003 TaxID=1423726 RepID=A0A0R1GUA3_9LACO|nr:glycosyltransferase family 4 protein [Loigolactobacillus bifermentans]KRK34359.1 glycosyltransferase [Loigolactobacillus bifermentans DSM 20003]QGG60061.1 glycosyltransferase [Loigolactobacillus bifermentans]
MNIGLFTDTYFPQVSGVATSIKTLKEELEREGHTVYIFTTTDPDVDKDQFEPNIFRFASVPFISFKERRIAIRGLFRAYQVARDLELDIVHTQTEFSMGYIGKFVAKNLHIPCVHTYHTMYQDYLHYILNGKLVRPYHVKQAMRAYLHNMHGIVAPSSRVVKTLRSYGVKTPMEVIPTGINLCQYDHPVLDDPRVALQIAPTTNVLLSLSRIAFEKKIDEVIAALPAILAVVPNTVLVIVGDGPARETLQNQAKSLGIWEHVIFTGEVPNEHVAAYYHMADLFLSASESESQGLTYIEAMASGLKSVAAASPYTNDLLDDPAIGTTFTSEPEMVQQVTRYLAHPQVFNDPSPRLRKLELISAPHFGHRVIQFYRTAQIYYETLNRDSTKLSD